MKIAVAHRNIYVATVLVLAVTGCATLAADSETAPGRPLVARIEALLDDAYPADEPGAAVIVADGGKVIYHGARGMASLELGVPLEPDMVFRLGSISKQFTAAAILLLAEQGKLTVDDPITKYLPDYPVHGYTITIKHLLTHTSGIFSYTSIPEYMVSKVRRDLTTDELIAEFKAEEMEFAPGDALWNAALSSDQLLSEESRRALFTAHRSPTGRPPATATASASPRSADRSAGFARGDRGGELSV